MYEYLIVHRSNYRILIQAHNHMKAQHIQSLISLIMFHSTTASPNIHRYLAWRKTIDDKKAHVPYDCTVQTKTQFYCQRCIILQGVIFSAKINYK